MSAAFTSTLCACVALLASAAWQPAARAQDAGTVKVGVETKRTAGTITAMTMGDVACYLTLRDDKGAVFKELADFAICEQTSLLGKHVSLTYALQKVMSSECQGNPDCRKTRTVALVMTAKPLATGGQSSFCTPAEIVVFSCRTAGKMVSACASKDARGNRGYLQYRFGKAGSNDPLELVLPEGQVPPARAATGETVPFSGGGGSWLRFSKGAYAYVIYSGVGKWGPRGEIREKNGLVIENSGKQMANLRCTSTPIGELGAEWFGAVGVDSKNQDFDFPD